MSGGMAAAATWAMEALIASTLLMALVLAIRAPVRRWFGAQVGYALWALPALRMLLPPLPAAWREQVALPIAQAGETLTLIVLPGADAGVPETGSAVDAATRVDGPTLAALVLIGWAAVSLIFLGFQLVRHRRFCRRVIESGAPIDRVARVRILSSAAAPGPIAFGVVRPYVAFPADFAERYDADERALALAHELGHHARGDLAANWLGLVVLALHWFNPLAWRAHKAFRADQELANDARVLAGRSVYERHAYACAIVKAAHGGGLSAACHLHSIKDLKGRLRMLRNQVSRPRLISGATLVVATGVVALALTASGTRAAETVRASVADVAGVPLAAAPPPSTALLSASDGGAAAQARPRVHRIVIVENGRKRTYEGAAADAYLAANPDLAPPPPPAPAAAPAAPAAPNAPETPSAPIHAAPMHAAPIYSVATHHHAVAEVPTVVSRNCGGSSDEGVVLRTRSAATTAIVICTDRIEQQARRSAAYAVDARRVAQQARLAALDGLRAARAGMIADRSLYEGARHDALAAMDESIADIEREAKDD